MTKILPYLIELKPMVATQVITGAKIVQAEKCELCVHKYQPGKSSWCYMFWVIQVPCQVFLRSPKPASNKAINADKARSA